MPPRSSVTYLTQRNFTFALAGIVVLAIAAFFGYQFKFLRAPDLEISAPSQDIALEGTIFDVRGYVDPDADLTMNGRPLYSGESGEFTERVYLAKGVNELVFEAENRHGKSTVITRYIVVR